MPPMKKQKKETDALNRGRSRHEWRKLKKNKKGDNVIGREKAFDGRGARRTMLGYPAKT